MDVCAASMMLLLLSPVLVFVSVLVLAFDGRPILFRQERPGLRMRIFTLLKFRTMCAPRVSGTRREEQTTSLGKTLRRLSIDELPSLWNIVRGDMSFVGPRPLLPEYLPIMSGYHLRRHEVLPGLTGLAQVSGRNLISWRQKLDLDVEYVGSQSFHLDIKILAKTVPLVLGAKGVTRLDGSLMSPLRDGYDIGATEDN